MTNMQDSRKMSVNIAAIAVGAASLSCISSFLIYRAGFRDMPPIIQDALALFAVIAVKFAFIRLLYGLIRGFESGLERLLALWGMGFLASVMLINLITHFMMVGGLQLHPLQMEWIDCSPIVALIVVLFIVLCMTAIPPIHLKRSQPTTEDSPGLSTQGSQDRGNTNH